MSSPLFGRDEAKANIVVVEEPITGDTISLLSSQRDKETNASVEEPVEKKEKNEGNNESEIAQLNRPLFDLQIIEAKPPNYLPSPILQFPPEIISHIFYLTLSHFSIFPFHTGDYYSLFEKHKITPFILGAVCRHWRAVTWSTPILWSSMLVRFFAFDNNKSTLVKGWLSRSGQLPLSIRIFFQPTRWTAEADFRFFAEIINQYSSRWRHFDLSVPAKFSKFFQAEGTQGHAPMLESLRLDIRRRRNKFDLVTCPRLRKVHLVSARLSLINLPWNNVTHLCAQAMKSEDCFKILQNTPFLVHAEFLNTEEPRLYTSGSIIIASLKSLKVVGSHVPSFFSHITCPLLDELICDAQQTHFNLDDIIPFLARSGPLRNFSMLDFALRNSRLMGFLQAMPFLKILVLSQSISRKKALNILKVLGMIQSSQSNSFEPRFLPHLEILDYTGPLPLTRAVDLPIIISRDPTHPLPPDDAEQGPLRSITLKLCPAVYLPENTIQFFLGLMERGVTVNVLSNSEDILQSAIDYYNSDWVDTLDLNLMQDLF